MRGENKARKDQEEEFPAPQPWGRISMMPRHKFTKESEMGIGIAWGNFSKNMGLGGAILAEQSACVFRRASQHTIQWAWGGEICSFPPQGRRTARVSRNQISGNQISGNQISGNQISGGESEGWGGRKDCHNPFHNAHTIPSWGWEDGFQVSIPSFAIISWTILFSRARTGKSPRRRRSWW